MDAVFGVADRVLVLMQGRLVADGTPEAARRLERVAILDGRLVAPEPPEAVAARLEDGSAQEALEWMFESFGSDHYIACSFQKTSSVTAHLASSINPDARFFYLDTDVLFAETYETRDRLAEALDRLSLRLPVLGPITTPASVPVTIAAAEMTAKAGFYEKNPGRDVAVKVLSHATAVAGGERGGGKYDRVGPRRGAAAPGRVGRLPGGERRACVQAVGHAVAVSVALAKLRAVVAAQH